MALRHGLTQPNVLQRVNNGKDDLVYPLLKLKYHHKYYVTLYELSYYPVPGNSCIRYERLQYYTRILNSVNT